MEDNNQIPSQQPQPYPPPLVQYTPAPAKPKKPVYKKWWFWVLMVFVFIVFLAAVTGGDDDKPIVLPPTNAEGQTIAATARTTTTKATPTTENPEVYKALCQSIAFKDLARNPDKYKGQSLKISGKVIQVSEGWLNSVDLRINVTQGEYGLWDDTIYVSLAIPKGEDRILEDDIVTIWGDCTGQYSYKSVLGASISLPRIDGKYYSISN